MAIKTKRRKPKRFSWSTVSMPVVLHVRTKDEDLIPFYKSKVSVKYIDQFGYHTIIATKFIVIHMSSGYPIGYFNTKKEARILVKKLELLLQNSNVNIKPFIGPYNPEEDIPF